MIYRCRWCERGYCEDCLDFDKSTLIGDNLKEYELLGFPEITQAFYISCPSCHDHHVENLDAKAFCSTKALEYDADHKKLVESRTLQSVVEAEEHKVAFSSSRAESLTDATTMDDSGLNTPQVEGIGSSEHLQGKKRKLSPCHYFATPLKRSQRIKS